MFVNCGIVCKADRGGRRGAEAREPAGSPTPSTPRRTRSPRVGHAAMPVIDKHDIQKEVPFVNGNQVKPLHSRRQHHAEYTQ